ncbi:antitoxin VapB family protein [Thermococcus thermotolerans]|uniref:antitoxin VapB family protein n=1 Tax=Thermococcus thermotolerans TaxID=2969672 RepID=UPI002158307E|nr:antitoxin VapB family protein [Thermococcus thermotolerans]
MGKTMTIDNVYYELVKMKGTKSFSGLLRELIGKKKKGNLDVVMIAFGTMTEEGAKEFEKEMKEVEEWMDSWTPAW